jgi:multiple sugar transport system ATP-binding protein
MNLIPGKLSAGESGFAVETEDGVALPLPAHAIGMHGQPVHYGVRPDHLTVSKCGRSFEAVVEVVEPTGADTLVFARIGRHKICGAFTERYGFRSGERIALAPRLDCVHLFDAQSGSNLMLSQSLDSNDRSKGGPQ